ncbi:B3/4 domain-containing protein [Serratia microhaemolytica]|uniref:B3/B4 domain-containing protein n=1 Tax=Serratia microhaemolytica TaxID=2675110 RepID=UPI000FDD8230|nr:B3/4 domain-containing protein [Serratia microhaemolytica]
MFFSISEAASKVGVTHALFLVVRGLVCSPTKPEFLTHCNEMVETNISGDLQHFNEGFRKIIEKTTGRENFKTAGEKLRENFSSRGFRSINNIIDAYNEAAFFYGLGIGGHDLSSVDSLAKIEVSLATDNERIVPLFQSKEKKINPGELIYTADDKSMAWIGTNDIDADCFKISERTTDCLFVILGHNFVKAAELYTISLRIRQGGIPLCI